MIVELSVFYSEISGSESNNEHQPKVANISVSFIVSHFEISSKDNNSEDSENIKLKSIALSVILNIRQINHSYHLP